MENNTHYVLNEDANESPVPPHSTIGRYGVIARHYGVLLKGV